MGGIISPPRERGQVEWVGGFAYVVDDGYIFRENTAFAHLTRAMDICQGPHMLSPRCLSMDRDPR